MIEPLGMTSERLFQFGLIEPLEDAAHRRVGRRPPQRGTREGRVQKSEPPVDQGVDLTIRARPTHHRQNRKQDHAGLPVHLPFGASAVGNGGQAGEKICRHQQPPNRVAPHGFRPDSARKGGKTSFTAPPAPSLSDRALNNPARRRERHPVSFRMAPTAIGSTPRAPLLTSTAPGTGCSSTSRKPL